MKLWQKLLAGAVVVGGAVGVYFLIPVKGPERDLTLVADAAHGEYLLRVGGCIACHTDVQNEGAELAGGAPLETAFGICQSSYDGRVGFPFVRKFAVATILGVGVSNRDLWYGLLCNFLRIGCRIFG